MTDTYKKDGYLHVREAIPPADLEPLRACIQREVGNYANEMLGMGKINGPYENLPFGQRLAALHRETRSACVPGTHPYSAPNCTP